MLAENQTDSCSRHPRRDSGKSQRIEPSDNKIFYRLVDCLKHGTGPETYTTYGAQNRFGPATKSGNDGSDAIDNLKMVTSCSWSYSAFSICTKGLCDKLTSTSFPPMQNTNTFSIYCVFDKSQQFCNANNSSTFLGTHYHVGDPRDLCETCLVCHRRWYFRTVLLLLWHWL